MSNDIGIIESYIISGKTQLEISLILNVTPSTVYNRIRKKYKNENFQKIRERLTGSRYTVSTKQKRSIISKKQKPSLVKKIDKNVLESLILKDLYLTDICKLLNVTDPTLNKFIKKHYNCTFKYLREKITGEKVTRATINKLKNNIHYIFKNSKDFNILGRLYLLKVYNEKEEFYKIGITRTDVGSRYKSSMLRHFYKYTIEEEIEGNLFNLYQIEQSLKKIYSNYSYTPTYRFDGRTECFSIYIPLKIL